MKSETPTIQRPICANARAAEVLGEYSALTYQEQEALLRERLEIFLSELEGAQHNARETQRLNKLARELVELARQLRNKEAA